MGISRDKKIYLFCCLIVDAMASGGIATIIGKQDIIDFVGAFALILFMQNCLWGIIRKFDKT